MGMDAKACLWVGFRNEDKDVIEVVKKLPRSYGGYELEKIECCDGSMGFGIVVFSHDWDYGIIKFDASAIQHKVEKAKAAFNALLDECEIDIDTEVWFQTDFS